MALSEYAESNSALTVQEIVGRATFYAHFDNKDDLLLSGFDEFRALLKAPKYPDSDLAREPTTILRL